MDFKFSPAIKEIYVILKIEHSAHMYLHIAIQNASPEVKRGGNGGRRKD